MHAKKPAIGTRAERAGINVVESLPTVIVMIFVRGSMTVVRIKREFVMLMKERVGVLTQME